MSTATSQQQPATTQIRGVDHPRGLPPHEIPHEIQLEIPHDIPLEIPHDIPVEIQEAGGLPLRNHQGGMRAGPSTDTGTGTDTRTDTDM